MFLYYMSQTIESQHLKDLAYSIQLDKIARQAKPRDQRPPVKSISKVDEDMVREYNKQFEEIKKRTVPVMDEMSGEQMVDEEGKPMFKTVNYKYLPLAKPELIQPVIKPILTQRDIEEITYLKEKSIRRLERVNEIYRQIEEARINTMALYNNGQKTKEEAADELKYLIDQKRRNKVEEQDIKIELDLTTNHEKELINNELVNQAEINESRKQNIMKMTNYFEELKLLNSGSFNTERNIGETDEDYFRRLEQNAQEESTDDLILKSTLENNSKFKKLMKELIRDDAKIEAVLNTVSDKVKFEIVKKETLFKEKFLKLYGENNKLISITNIIEFCEGFYKSLSGDNYVLNYLSNVQTNIGLTEKVLNNMLIISNDDRSVFFKVIDTMHLKEVLDQQTIKQVVFSYTGKKGSFEPYIFNKTTSYVDEEEKSSAGGGGKSKKKREPEKRSDYDIAYYLNITTDKLRSFLGGVREETVLRYLLDIIRIAPETSGLRRVGITDDRRVMFGWGIGNEKLPELVKFGDLQLQLNKLYYKNFLSLRDKNNINIPSFNQVKVSDDFVKLMMNLVKGKLPSKMELELINSNEKNLFDRIIHLAKLHKNPSLEKHLDKNLVDELKQKLSLIEQDINAGNNSKDLVKEMEKILMILVDYGCITYKNAKSHIRQFI